MAQEVLGLDIKPVKDTEKDYYDPTGISNTSELIEYRFHLFGGSVHAVLRDPARAEDWVRSAINTTEWRGELGRTLSLEGQSLSSLFSHSLFHVDANDNFGPTYQFASNYIKFRIAEAALEEHDSKIDALMASSNLKQGTKGEMVEELFFRQFVLATRTATKDSRLALKLVGQKQKGTPPLQPPDKDKLDQCLRMFSDVSTR